MIPWSSTKIWEIDTGCVVKNISSQKFEAVIWLVNFSQSSSTWEGHKINVYFRGFWQGGIEMYGQGNKRNFFVEKNTVVANRIEGTC